MAQEPILSKKTASTTTQLNTEQSIPFIWNEQKQTHNKTTTPHAYGYEYQTFGHCIRDPVVLNAFHFGSKTKRKRSNFPCAQQWQKRCKCCAATISDAHRNRAFLSKIIPMRAQIYQVWCIYTYSFVGCPFLMLFRKHKQNIYLLKQATACVSNGAFIVSPCANTKCIAQHDG